MLFWLMSKRTTVITDKLYQYILSVSLREADILRRLREETAKDSMAHMQIAPEQGQFIAFLIKLIGAKFVLELGVYTGYSTLCSLYALPEDGRLIACDTSEQWTSIAKKFWDEAGVSHKVHLCLAPAVLTLEKLLKDGKEGGFDFVFIDADKENYNFYYEYSLKLIRRGGLIAIDNVLWEGKVADASFDDSETKSICALNEKLHNDSRIDISIIPMADGLTLIRKR